MTEFFSPSELFLEEPWQDLTPISQLEGKEGKPGPQGVAGNSFRADKQGLASGKSVYDNAPLPFSYLAEDTGLLYFRTAPTGWTQGFPFSKGDKGDNGKPVEFNHSATHLQWRYIGDTVWINLIDLNSIRGKDGDPATNLIKSVNGLTGDVVLNAKMVGAVKEPYAIDPVIDLPLINTDCILPEWFTRPSTATYFDKDGNLKTAALSEPRIDHDPKTLECLGLLLEPTSINITTHSENLGHSDWAKTRCSVEIGPVIKGAQFWKFTPDTSLQQSHQVTNNRTFSALAADTVYSASILVKQNGESTNKIAVRCWDSIGFIAYVFFDLTTLTMSPPQAGVTSTITDIGEDVRRITVSFTVRLGATSSGVQLFAAHPSSNSTTTFDYNGVDGYLVSAAQFESMPFPTSYIPTTTVAVSRIADQFILPLDSSLFKKSGGTLYVEGKLINAASNGFTARLHESGQLNNYIGVPYQTASSGGAVNRSGYMRNGGDSSSSTTANGGVIPLGEKVKAALAWSDGAFYTRVNGSPSQEVVHENGAPAANELRLGGSATGAFSGRICYVNHVSLYPVKIPSSDLEKIVRNY